MPSLNIVEKTLKHKSDYEDSRPLAIKELLAQRADLVKPIDEKLKLLGYQEDSKPAKKDKKGQKDNLQKLRRGRPQYSNLQKT